MMKIKEYKIIQDKELHPKLKCIQSFNIEKSYLDNYTEIINLFNELYQLNVCSEEYVYVIALNSDNEFLGIINISHGSQTESNVYIKTIFTFLLLVGASKYFVIHNHPNGTPEISSFDFEITNLIESATNLFETEFVEHIIISRKGYSLIKQSICKYMDQTEKRTPFHDIDF